MFANNNSTWFFFSLYFWMFDESRSIDINPVFKAVHKVPHKLLRNKLSAHSTWITFTIGSWPGSRRKHRVVLIGVSSNLPDARSVVPHRSVRGPVFFSLVSYQYLRMTQKIFIKVTMTLDEEAWHTDLDVLARWANQWQKKLNVDKCKALQIGNNV